MHDRKRGRGADRRACLAILAIFAILTGFSIGILVLPIVALVALAVAATPLP